MRPGKFRQRHRGLEDALHGWIGRKVDLLRDRDRDMADHADVGEGRRIAAAVERWATSQGAILICGRYEGIDQRFIDTHRANIGRTRTPTE